jgi:hypothetical protein
MRKARSKVQDLPAGFRYHDLRHCSASLLAAEAPTSGLSTPGTAAEQRHG